MRKYIAKIWLHAEVLTLKTPLFYVMFINVFPECVSAYHMCAVAAEATRERDSASRT